MAWWSWLVVAIFVILAVYFLFPRRNRSNNDTESSQGVPAESLGIQPRSSFNFIYLWAVLGGAVLIFQLYVWIKWIAGPYFERVHSGPSDPPLWMKVSLLSLTSAFWVGVVICIYFLIIRPWRRERRITLDGILFVVFGLMLFQDPLLNYLNTWSTYNTWLFNRACWVQDIPGWLSFGEPGAMLTEPILLNVPGYAVGIFFCTILGCWIMRLAKRRWPNISTFRMIVVIFIFMFFWDIFMEGMFFMRIGFYTYPGSIKSLCLFPGHYYQFPIYQAALWGPVQASICCLRYFKDDRGRTFVERGLERINGGLVKQQGIRFLAIFAVCSTFFFVGYNIPTQWLAMHAEPWPEDIQKRSYFTSYICGEGTGRPCPDPSLPLLQNDRAYVDPDGNLVLPDGYELPEIIPYERPND